MSLKTLDEQYHVRESLYNLVELSLLARLFEEYCTPNSFSGEINRESLSATLLKMKASEGKGLLRVLIYKSDPVGFYWVLEDQVMAQWVHPDHKGKGLENTLKNF